MAANPCDRTAKSCGLLLLYYFCFYGVLAAIFSSVLTIFVNTLPKTDNFLQVNEAVLPIALARYRTVARSGLSIVQYSGHDATRKSPRDCSTLTNANCVLVLTARINRVMPDLPKQRLLHPHSSDPLGVIMPRDTGFTCTTSTPDILIVRTRRSPAPSNEGAVTEVNAQTATFTFLAGEVTDFEWDTLVRIADKVRGTVSGTVSCMLTHGVSLTADSLAFDVTFNNVSA